MFTGLELRVNESLMYKKTILLLLLLKVCKHLVYLVTLHVCILNRNKALRKNIKKENEMSSSVSKSYIIIITISNVVVIIIIAT